MCNINDCRSLKFGNKMADVIFSKIVPLDPKTNRTPEDDILNRFAVLRKNRK